MNALALPSRQLVSQSDASIVQRADVPRSRFTGAWSRKTAFDAGYLVPILVEEILPGDHMTYDVTAYVRMSTPLFPMLDNQRIDTFFFYVPSRLVWDNWARFMGEQDNPAQSIDLTLPVVPVPANLGSVGSIWDHFGLPPVPVALDVNALPFRAYNLIFNEWFRDQNIQAELSVTKTDGPDLASAYALRKRNKAHDYFTSALPWPQKFDAPSVALGGGMAPVYGLGVDSNTTSIGPSPMDSIETGGQQFNYPYYRTGDALVVKVDRDGINSVPQIYADLETTTGITINALREAWLAQSLLERDARGGTRYTELIKSHFGVVNPDFRLQRPEYIGGGQTPLQLTPIAQTAPTAGAPVGALGAAGTAAGSHRASFAATEHGYILGLINIRSDLSYQQGLHRMWARRTRFDFYWPALAGLGEQAILRQEIYATGDPLNDDEVFGYQERHHEYRTRTSEVTGIMRSSAAGTLDAWHLAQSFASAPTLSDAFIEDNPPMTRVLAAAELATGQQYLADILFRRTAVRPVPAFGTPSQLGRF